MATADMLVSTYTSTKDVPDDATPAGSNTYTSDPYTPTEPGIYQWTATFTPDSGQGDPSGEIGCGETVEQSVVNGGAPTTTTLTTDASNNGTEEDPAQTLGGSISDTATLSGRRQPDRLDHVQALRSVHREDPSTDQCIDSGDGANLVTTLGPVDIGEADEPGNYGRLLRRPAVTTDDFVPTEAGRYQWVASYSGDDTHER